MLHGVVWYRFVSFRMVQSKCWSINVGQFNSNLIELNKNLIKVKNLRFFLFSKRKKINGSLNDVVMDVERV